MAGLKESPNDLEGVGIDIREDPRDTWALQRHIRARAPSTTPRRRLRAPEASTVMWSIAGLILCAIHMFRHPMHGLIQPLHAFVACSGPALVLGRYDTSRSLDELPLALAGVLGAREADGLIDRVIVLRLVRRDDAEWARIAADWLAVRGRRVVLRTHVVLPPSLEETARRWGCTVLLELAHRRAAMQTALVGESADSAATLLAHAQHLRRVGLQVAVHLGPLFPVIHEERTDTLALLRHIAAADVHDVHLTVGRLTEQRYAAVASVLPICRAQALLRVFGLDASASQPFASVAAAGRRLVPLAMTAMYHSVRLDAEGEDLRVDHCGCAAQCHLDPQVVPRFVPLLTADLFANAG